MSCLKSKELPLLDDSISCDLQFMNERQSQKHRKCVECGNLSRCKKYLTGKPRGLCENPECNAFLCKSCKKKYVLMPRSSMSLVDVDPYDSITANEWRNGKFRRYCRECYMEVSLIDFDTHSTVFEPSPEKNRNITIIFSHGAGGSRATFLTHAREMAKKYGIRSIVMDFAGHGARWEEKCTLKTCMNAIKEVLETYNIKKLEDQEVEGRKTFFVGSSWGGYMGYHAMGFFSEYFHGLIVDSSVRDLSRRKEKIKWSIISKVVDTASYYTMLTWVRKRWVLSGKPYMDCIEAKFGAGIYAKSKPMRTMAGFKFEDCIPKIKCPILFLNGTNDPDGYDPKCQEKILSLLMTREHSNVVLFEGGDHIFSHDFRFFEKWMKSTIDFVDTTNFVCKN